MATSFTDYDKNSALMEYYCNESVNNNIKDFSLKWLNEDGESFDFDAMLYSPTGIEIPLEYQCSLNWYGSYPSHWQYTKWFKQKTDTKYNKFKNGNWKTGFFLTFNANCSLFYIATFENIVKLPYHKTYAYRNGTNHLIESYYTSKDKMYLFHIEDINEVFLHFNDKDFLDNLKIKV